MNYRATVDRRLRFANPPYGRVAIVIRDLQEISGDAIGALPGRTPVKSNGRVAHPSQDIRSGSARCGVDLEAHQGDGGPRVTLTSAARALPSRPG